MYFAEGKIARQTDRQTERNMTQLTVAFRILQTPFEIGEKEFEEKPISKKKLPRINIYTEVFHCLSA
jgi:hypothetical protein